GSCDLVPGPTSSFGSKIRLRAHPPQKRFLRGCGGFLHPPGAPIAIAGPIADSANLAHRNSRKRADMDKCGAFHTFDLAAGSILDSGCFVIASGTCVYSYEGYPLGGRKELQRKKVVDRLRPMDHRKTEGFHVEKSLR